MLRRIFIKAMKGYGPGVAHLEKILQETTIDIVDAIQQKDGEPVDTYNLSTGYVCCVTTSMVMYRGDVHER